MPALARYLTFLSTEVDIKYSLFAHPTTQKGLLNRADLKQKDDYVLFNYHPVAISTISFYE